MTSGISNDELAAEARAAGADGHLQKGAIHTQVVDAVLQAAARE